MVQAQSDWTPEQRGWVEELLSRSRPSTPEERAEGARRIAAYRACRLAFYGQDYLPQPAIWRLGDADTTIYLFGTVHLLPLEFDWRSPQLDAIIDRSDLLVTETGPDERLTARPHDLEKGRHPPLLERVSGRHRAHLAEELAALSKKARRYLDRQPTWLAAFVLDVASDDQISDPGADPQLEAEFRKKGRPIAAIEDSDALLARLSALPERRQRRLLRSMLDDIRARDATKRFDAYHSWARGEDRSIQYRRARVVLGADIHELLLRDRNRAWTNEVGRLLDRPGQVLVAVGAAHLQGRDSLVAMLRRRGHAVTRVSPQGPATPRASFLPKPASMADCEPYLLGTRTPTPGG